MKQQIEPVLTVSEMQASEQALIDAGVSIDELMQRAGRGAAEWVWRIAAGRAVTVLCGHGNNGGDGFVIAETLRRRGLQVVVIAPNMSSTDAARKAASDYVGDVVTSPSETSGQVLVDCLFGSGLSRPLPGDLAAMLTILAERHHTRIAIDLPSGIESDSGALLGPVPRFDLTIALGAWKRAHFLMPAMPQMGTLKLVDIGARPRDTAYKILRPRLAAPGVGAHKYTRGLLAIVGGAMVGASLLCARSAMLAGAGYVKLLTDCPPSSVPPDLVVDQGNLPGALADDRIRAVLAGPGMGRSDAASLRLKAVLDRDLPTVLDADALVLLEPNGLPPRVSPMILTPHEGEMAVLERRFGLEGGGAKPQRAQALAKVTGAVIIAKGPDTLIADPDGRLAFAGGASSWLSAAGTGDVLAGIVASRLAAGREPFSAASEAVWLHAEAARLAGPAFSAGMLAERVRDAYAACL